MKRAGEQDSLDKARKQAAARDIAAAETADDVEAAIAGQARDWVMKIAAGELSAQELRAFHAWRDADSRHRAAYQRSRRAWQALGELDHLRGAVSPELLEPASRKGRWRRLWSVGDTPRIAWGLAAAAALVLVALWLPMQRLVPLPQGGQFSSGTGEVRLVRLEDGSSITLGADSAMQVELTATQRRVRLLRGEAYFDVARDEQRPFLVRVNDVAVRVLGTRFEVHKGVAATRVMVEHGLVTVQAPAPKSAGEEAREGEAALLLAAGEAAVKAPGDPWTRLDAGSPPTTGWRDGRLAYDGAPLREVIADANRYYDQVIELADPDLGELRVTASFRTREISQMIGVLEGAVGVRAERAADGRLMLFAPDS